MPRCRAAGLHLPRREAGFRPRAAGSGGTPLMASLNRPEGWRKRDELSGPQASPRQANQTPQTRTLSKSPPTAHEQRDSAPQSDKGSPRRKRYSLHLIASRSLSLNEPKVTPPGSSCYYRAVQPPRGLCPGQPSRTNPAPSTSGYVSNRLVPRRLEFGS